MRRPLIAAAAVAAVFLTGCSAAESTGDGGEAAWTYVSGDGETYTLPDMPDRIIAEASAAKALMEFGIEPIGIWASSPVEEDVALQGVDFSGMTILGEEWGKIDVAAAAELQPDLIVGDWWPVEQAYSGLEAGVEEESKKLAELAPVVGPAQSDSVVTLIEGYAELAESLGADPDQIAESRTEFETALADFQAATAGKPGLTALAISPYDTSYAIAVPEHAPELLDFQQWGLNVINPDAPDPDFPYWETLSMENADKYQPDLILFDDRWHPGNEETLAAAPIASSIAAYEAGQTTTWPGYWLHTYSDYAAQLTRLAEVIRGTDENLVQE